MLPTSFSIKTTRFDLVSGFIVFLIALPLCIGISVASNAPASAGIITAIVGGILGSVLTGSFLTINGPAAGLIVIVAACVEEMGQGDPMTGYKKMLACAVIAGGIQIFLGIFRAGKLGLAFPSTVVHAMMSAIGVIIISKQLYPLMGLSGAPVNPLMALVKFPTFLAESNLGIAIIGLICLGILILATELAKKNSILKAVPIPFLAALTGVGLGLAFDLEHQHTVDWAVSHFSVGPKSLLAVPDKIAEAIYHPDFSSIFSGPSIKHGFIIAFVASIESILSACAVDRLDPMKRRSNLNFELVGKGICNMIAPLLGGIPMIAEIVRSSANISNGAKTQLSNFFHGLFLVLFLGLVPQYLHLVPVTSLAAILIFVGYQLAKPSHFHHAFSQGKDQGIVFLITLFGILGTDLLVGVLMGTVAEFIGIVIRSKTFDLFRIRMDSEQSEEKVVITLKSPLVFTNHLGLKKALDTFRSNTVSIDLRSISTVDVTSRENLNYWSRELESRGQKMEILSK